MKKLLMIVIFGLLIINNSNADIIKLNNCKYIGKSENRNYTTNISIDTINKTLELSSEKEKKIILLIITQQIIHILLHQ